MAQPSGTLATPIPPAAQEALIAFYCQCAQISSQSWNFRQRLATIDLAYMREVDNTDDTEQSKKANRAGDSTKFRNVVIPVIKPQVEAAVTYQASVFLSGSPMFAAVASPEFEDQALAMNTVIDEQATRGGWVAEFLKFFRDGFKYNLSAIEIDWAQEVSYSLSTDVLFSAKEAKPTELLWEGNKVTHWNLYNTFFDPRVAPVKLSEHGEFVGNVERLSRIALKTLIAKLPVKIIGNIKAALESSITEAGDIAFFIPELNKEALSQVSDRSFNWESWAGLAKSTQGINYKDSYDVTTMYARILPADFGLKVPAPNTPQIWKFIIVNHSVLLYAERLTNAHNRIPVLFGQPYEDGLGYQTKSMAQEIEPLQAISTALANSVIHARRRSISDRMLYDPSRVSTQHINNPSVTARIPVKPAAYGKPLSEAVYPIPFRDEQSQFAMQQMQQMQSFANNVTGQNQAKQGQFVKGNKTQHEYSDVMSHANGRDQTIAMLYEAQVFTPMKEILKINILQFQGGTSLYNREKKQSVQIDPLKLRTAVLNFKISDGLTPIDKLISADTLQVAMQTVASSAVINSQYNIGPMFSYLMKTQGADIAPFEKSPAQVTYENAVQQWNNLAMAAIQKNVAFSLPQPKPADYGYDPAAAGESGAATAQVPDVTQKVNNITNNITNSEA